MFLLCFWQVTGDTVYNMLRLADVECDNDERPLNPHKIRATEVRLCPVNIRCDRNAFSFIRMFVQVLHNAFDDIVPRESKAKKEKNKDEGKKSQSKATKYGVHFCLSMTM